MSVSAETWARAAAVSANPQSGLAEIAAVHDLLWPAQAPICPTLTCTRKLGEAWRTIAGAVRRHEAGTVSFPPSSNPSRSMKKSARRLRDNQSYSIHNGPTYTNENLTPELVATILKNDPDAERLFEPADEEVAEAGTSTASGKNSAADADAGKPAGSSKKADAGKASAKGGGKASGKASASPAASLTAAGDTLSTEGAGSTSSPE